MRAFERFHCPSTKLNDASSVARAAGSVRALHGNDPRFCRVMFCTEVCFGVMLFGWLQFKALGRLVSDRFVKSAVTPFPVRIDPLSCGISTPESRSLSGFWRPRLWVLCHMLGDHLVFCKSLLPVSSPWLTFCLGVSPGWLVEWGFSLPLFDFGLSCFPFLLFCFVLAGDPRLKVGTFLLLFLPSFLSLSSPRPLSLADACAPSVCPLFCF